MSIQLARRAIRLYSCDLAPLHVNKANRRSWLRMVRLLGDKWVGLPRQKEQLNG